HHLALLTPLLTPFLAPFLDTHPFDTGNVWHLSLPATAWAEGAQLIGRPFPATASAEGAQFNVPPFPATASAEGAQFNVPPSLSNLKALTAELDSGECLTMRPRLHALVTEQLRTVRQQIAEFHLLERQLAQVLQRLQTA